MSVDNSAEQISEVKELIFLILELFKMYSSPFDALNQGNLVMSVQRFDVVQLLQNIILNDVD